MTTPAPAPDTALSPEDLPAEVKARMSLSETQPSVGPVRWDFTDPRLGGENRALLSWTAGGAGRLGLPIPSRWNLLILNSKEEVAGSGWGPNPEVALLAALADVEVRPFERAQAARRLAVHRAAQRLCELPPVMAQGPSHKRPYVAEWCIEYEPNARRGGLELGIKTGTPAVPFEVAVFVAPLRGSRLSPPALTRRFLMGSSLTPAAWEGLPDKVAQILQEELLVGGAQS